MPLVWRPTAPSWLVVDAELEVELVAGLAVLLERSPTLESSGGSGEGVGVQPSNLMLTVWPVPRETTLLTGVVARDVAGMSRACVASWCHLSKAFLALCL